MAFFPRRRRDDEYDQFMVDDPGADPMPALPDLRPPRPVPLAGPNGAPYEAPRATPPFRQSRGAEMAEARDVYLQGAPGRGKSALKGALLGGLRGLAQGGLGGALGGAVGGALGGGVNPRGLREQEFNQQIRPRIQERFGYEDQAAQAQRQAEQDELNNQFKLAQINATNRSNLPRPVRPPALMNTPGGVLDPETRTIVPGTQPQPKEKETPYSKGFGRNRKTGRLGYYNVRDKQEAAEYDPAPPLSRPRTPGAPKAKKEGKFVSITQVRKAAEENGISESDASTAFRSKGYTIVR